MKAQLLCDSIARQFYARTVVESGKSGFDPGATLEIKRKDNQLWFLIRRADELHTITVPIPFMKNGIQLIMQNDVTRSVCNYFIREENIELDYFAIIGRILTGNAMSILPTQIKKRTSFIQQIAYSFKNENTSIIIYNLQRAINEVINRMPLHETDMNSLIMNQRLVIIDPEFEAIENPTERLQYQIDKAKEFFPRGWTPIGLSDGTLSDKNYTLKVDIRKITPFGMRYHNPQRNLYSTLGMKGDEVPLVRSESIQKLMKMGVTRKGWNLTTLFADIPDVFEDQIVVDKSHLDKYVTYTKRYQIFGEVLVSVGDSLKHGQIMGKSPDGQPNFFKIICEEAKVLAVKEAETNVGGRPVKMHNVIVEYRRYFKDGFKFTNMHGNKGVIRMMDLGYAVDPRTGEHRKVDVIVSAKSIKKRKNYGQLLEALLNVINEDKPFVVQKASATKLSAYERTSRRGNEDVYEDVKPSTFQKTSKISAYLKTSLRGNEEEYVHETAKPYKTFVVPDDFEVSMETIQNRLEKEGLPRDGMWECNTYAGKVTGIVGTVFWGVTKTPEEALWNDGVTTRTNNKELRTAGLKFSTVEFRSITTRFGKDNAILDEIMSYSQGSDMLNEELNILRSKRAEIQPGKRVVNASTIKPVDQTYGTIVPEAAIKGTVVDEEFIQEGFVLRLPVWYQVLTDHDGEVDFEGPPQQMSGETIKMYKSIKTFQDVYIPSGDLRKCWRHDAGDFGLSVYGVLINNLVVMCHRYAAEPNEVNTKQLYGAIRTYFGRVASIMGTKRGDISTYAMAVRYPYSGKATATLSTTLPKNTIEIHRNMADEIRVKNGDIILAERFPCLGFMSVRPQKIRITDDPMCKYTIRVSGNSLVSQGLDFDGDVEFIASFHTPEAKALLLKEWTNPNKSCYEVILKLNDKAGKPHFKNIGLDEYDISPFEDLTNDHHALLVERATGVKSHTGPVIALAYNLMRIVEHSDVKDNQKTNVAIEVFLDRVGNSVFQQKHGIEKSLHDVVIESICRADVETLVENGFNRETTTMICNLITEKAAALGIHDLDRFHENAKKRGGNLITFIVRNQNKIYFASRANLEGCKLLDHLEADAVDVPSKMFKWSLTGISKRIKTSLEEHVDADLLSKIKNKAVSSTCGKMFEALDIMFGMKECTAV